ncbi:alpha/beta fold hydrolase [Bacillus badius]|uniref:alpha/beta hydrolase family protein n=1 Tax=Bacillus badius TaxID=1455 RepID=UPI001CBE642A|nr:alpha/beta fold hydrolase [Bacillus badius]MED0665163.1 alpha/beta fold hydrolase [Bacillus badius]UAT31149.1 lysophospholipase [Bacillus badius]
MMIEKEIIIEKDIFATVTCPQQAGVFPAVLLIAGSGPIDRDGNGKKGKYPTNLYKELAAFFTELGFMTLRYDKHGTGKRQGDWRDAGLSDLLSDAKAAAAFLQGQPNVSKVIVCGHSEGTILATDLAATMAIDGCMLLSGGVDNLMEALIHQRKQAYRELLEMPGWKGWINRKLKVDEINEKKAEKLLEKMKASKRDTIRVQGIKQPAKWFREHADYQTRAALQRVTCPVFALHGNKDPLVDSTVLEELAGLVQGESEYHVVEDMEHGLREQAEPKSILKTKALMKTVLTRPLHKEGLQLMAGWLKRFLAED